MTGRGGVVVVGSVTADLTATSYKLPAPGETVLGDSFAMVAGGKGGNQALASARMGVPTWIVARVGNDQFADVVLAAMSDAGVRPEYLQSTPDAQTGIAHIRVNASGENDIVMVPLANGRLRPVNVNVAIDSLAGCASVLLTQLEIPLSTSLYALRRGRETGMITICDPAPVAPIPIDAFPLIDVITPNEREASQLTGIDVHDVKTASAAARKLLENGCGAVVVTLGDNGCLLATKGSDPELYPALPAEVVDTVGAGDAFTGTLGSRLALGGTLADALDWANAAGALATTVSGASPAMPDLEQVRSLLQNRIMEEGRQS